MILEQKQWLELADQTHAAMVAKGFWNDNRPIWKTMALIESELFEAFEAVRKGHYMDLKRFHASKPYHQNDAYFLQIHKACIKDTAEAEIAGAYIRVLDYAGRERTSGINVGTANHLFELVNNLEHYVKRSGFKTLFEDAPTEDAELDYIVHWISKNVVPKKFLNNYIDNEQLAQIIVCLEETAKLANFDLLELINIESHYNSLRQYKHGKKF